MLRLEDGGLWLAAEDGIGMEPYEAIEEVLPVLARLGMGLPGIMAGGMLGWPWTLKTALPGPAAAGMD